MIVSSRDNSTKAVRPCGEQGVSVLELLIVMLMITTMTGYALTKMASAKQFRRVENTSREFMSYVEKARLDSIRRHAGPPGALPQPDMSYVRITGPLSYEVVMDFDGDGSIDSARTINIPAEQGVVFNTGTTTLPITLAFNWRGRTVSTTTTSTQATYITPPSFSLQSNSPYNNHSARVNVTTSGDSSITSTNANITQPNPVQIDTGANTNIRSGMGVTNY